MGNAGFDNEVENTTTLRPEEKTVTIPGLIAADFNGG